MDEAAEARVRAIRDRLREMYGRPVERAPRPPDRRAGADDPLAEHKRPQPRHRLRPGCASGSPPGRRSATRRPAELEDALRPGGLSPPPRHRGSSMSSRGSASKPDLDWLDDRTPGGGARLPHRPARGRAGRPPPAFLIFALGRPRIPVDTHVHRVGGRLGLFPPPRLLRGGPRRDAGRSSTPRTPTSCT